MSEEHDLFKPVESEEDVTTEIPLSMALTVDPDSVKKPSIIPERLINGEHNENESPTIYLPEEGALEPSAEATNIKGRILLMEGDVETANDIVDILDGADYELELAMDAKYALILADTFEPEIILLDMTLPGLSGADMKQILRAAPNFAGRFVDIPILYLGEQEHIVKQRFHSSPETPMTRYIMKPVNPQELRDKVARAFAELHRKRAGQQA